MILFKPEYFWDTDVSKLDELKSKRLIIERVLSLGTIDEILSVIDCYGIKEVKRVITSLNTFDPKSLVFYSSYFKIPKKNFKCYSRKLLNPVHWS